jgi:hypothetical protein
VKQEEAMEETKVEKQEGAAEDQGIRNIIRDAIQEFITSEQSKAEPAYKAELLEERKRRELLERRVNELSEENRRSRQIAEEAERNSTVRSELQRLGVSKVDLAFRAVKDDVVRTEDGRLVARGSQGEMALKEYLAQFVHENPELLPARIPGGSGATSGQRTAAGGGGVDIEKIRPGMSSEELDAVRREIARIASQSLQGL